MQKCTIHPVLILLLALPFKTRAQHTDAGHPILYAQTDRSAYLPGETVWFKFYTYNDAFIDSSSQNIYVDYYDRAKKLIGHQMYISYRSVAKGQFTIPKTVRDDRIWMVAYRKNDLANDPGNYLSREIRIYQGDKTTASLPNPSTVSQPPAGPSRIYVLQDTGFVTFSFHNEDRAYDTITLQVLSRSDTLYAQSLSVHDKPRLLLHLPSISFANGLHEVYVRDQAGSIIDRKAFFHNDRTHLANPVLRKQTSTNDAASLTMWELTELPAGNMSISVTDADLPAPAYPLPYMVYAKPFLRSHIPELTRVILDTTGKLGNLSDSLSRSIRPALTKPAGPVLPPDKLITVRGILRKLNPKLDRDFYPSFVDLDIYNDQGRNVRYKTMIINDSIIKVPDLFFFDTTIARGLVLREGDPVKNYRIFLDSIYHPLVAEPILEEEIDGSTATEAAIRRSDPLAQSLHAYDSNMHTITLATVNIRASQKDRARKVDAMYTNTFFSSHDAASMMVVEDDSNFTRKTFEMGTYIANHTPGLVFNSTPLLGTASNATNVRPGTGADPMASSDPEVQMHNRYSPSPYFEWPGTRNGIGAMIYLDEENSTYDQVRNLPLGSISYIKVFRDNFHGPIGYVGSAISIYTKKNKSQDYYKIDHSQYTRVQGYTYTENTNDPVDDSHFQSWNATLLWNPDVQVHSSKDVLKLIFKNNSFTRRYRVVIEGLSAKGEPIYAEKIVE
jgi:hypothetical protein